MFLQYFFVRLGVQFSVLLDEEDDLSEVQPDAVPDEVSYVDNQVRTSSSRSSSELRALTLSAHVLERGHLAAKKRVNWTHNSISGRAAISQF